MLARRAIGDSAMTQMHFHAARNVVRLKQQDS